MRRTVSVGKRSGENATWIETMDQQIKSSQRFAVCINNAEYPVSLELFKIYRVLPDEDAAVDGDLRVIDESGEDYLYPAAYFVLIELPQEVEQAILQTSKLAA